MKRYSYLLLAALLGMLTFVSCSDNDDECTEVSGLKVVKTTLDMTYQGGTGIIELNQSNLTAEASAEWIKTSCEGDKVNLTIERNNGYEARTAIVTIRPNGGTEEQKVPITQLGIISIIGVEAHTFDYHGETVDFLWDTTDEFTIDNLPEWLTYRVEDGKIYFTAEALPLTGSSRSAVVRIKVGQLIDKQVKFEQPLPALPYESIIGKYEMSYIPMPNKDRIAPFEVELVEKENGVSFNLEGLGYPVEVLYDKDLPGIVIHPKGNMIKTPKLTVHFAAITKSFSVSWNPEISLVGKCDNSHQIAFQLKDDGADYGWNDNDTGKRQIPAGFVLFLPTGNILPVAHSVMFDIELTKK